MNTQTPVPSNAAQGVQEFFDALVEGRLSLGQTVKQSALCDVLGISLAGLREVCLLLEAEGLIEVRKRVGVKIFYPDVAFVRDTFQYRELLECEGLRRLADAPPDNWVAEMTQIHAETLVHAERAKTAEGYRVEVKALEDRFHGSLIAAFHNRQISANYDRTMQKMYLFRLLRPESVNLANTATAFREHAQVIERVAAGDADGAVAALRNHFSGVLRRTLAT